MPGTPRIQRAREAAALGLVLAVLVLTALISGIAFLRPTPPTPPTAPVRTPSASPAPTGAGPGSVDLALGSPSFVFQVPGLLPGTSVAATLPLVNGGQADLRFAMVSTSTDAEGKGLAAALLLEIRVGRADCTRPDGAVLYSGPLAGAALGRPAPGADPGDRSLRPGATETLCLRVTLPSSAGNALQEAATSTRFTFVAEAATP